jgi:hypothetical protein
MAAMTPPYRFDSLQSMSANTPIEHHTADRADRAPGDAARRTRRVRAA